MTSPGLFTALTPCDFRLFPKLNDHERSTSGIDSGRQGGCDSAAKTLTAEDSRTAPESGRNDGTRVAEARGRVLRGTLGRVLFTVMADFNLTIPRSLCHAS